MYKILIILITILCLGCNNSKAATEKTVEPSILKKVVTEPIYATHIGYFGVSVFIDPETNIEYFIVGNRYGIAITPRLKQEVKN